MGARILPIWLGILFGFATVAMADMEAPARSWAAECLRRLQALDMNGFSGGTGMPVRLVESADSLVLTGAEEVSEGDRAWATAVRQVYGFYRALGGRALNAAVIAETAPGVWGTRLEGYAPVAADRPDIALAFLLKALVAADPAIGLDIAASIAVSEPDWPELLTAAEDTLKPGVRIPAAGQAEAVISLDSAVVGRDLVLIGSSEVTANEVRWQDGQLIVTFSADGDALSGRHSLYIYDNTSKFSPRGRLDVDVGSHPY